jgi:parallel beta-helix repeat protein
MMTGRAPAQEVEIPKAVVDSAVWSGCAAYNFDGTNDTAKYLQVAWLVEQHRIFPNLQPSNVTASLSAIGAKWAELAQTGLTEAECVESCIYYASTLPPVGGVAIKNALIARFFPQEYYGSDALKPLFDENVRKSTFYSLREAGYAALVDAHDSAQSPGHQSLRQSLDNLCAPAIGASVTAGARAVLDKNPGYLANNDFLNSILPTGVLRLADTVIRRVQSEQFQKGWKLFQDSMDYFDKLDDLQKNGPMKRDYASEAERKAAVAEAQALAAANKEIIDAAGSTVDTLSTLVSFISPTWAKTISKIGHGVIDFAAKFQKLTGSSALWGVTKTLAAVLPVVQWISAGVGICMMAASLFSDGFGSSGPDKQTMEALRQLSLQIEDLRKEMHERFDRIDEKLDEILRTLDERFDRIDWVLYRLTEDIVFIQETLYSTQAQLYGLEGNIYGWLIDGFWQEFVFNFNYGIHYEDQNLHPMSELEYIQTENVLYSYAHDLSRDSLRAGSMTPDLSPDEVLPTLKTKRIPLANNINYLSQFPKALGLAPLSTESLPNPKVWSVATKAHLLLAEENPRYSNRNPAHITTLRQDGIRLDTALSTIYYTSPGWTGESLDGTFFGSLLSYYEAQFGGMKAAIEAKQQTYIADKYVAFSDGTVQPGLDLWGGPDQSTGYVPVKLRTGNVLEVSGNPANPPGLELPGGLLSSLPSALPLAEALGLGSLTFTYSLERVNVTHVRIPEGHEQSQMRFDVRVNWDGQEVMKFTSDCSFEANGRNKGDDIYYIDVSPSYTSIQQPPGDEYRWHSPPRLFYDYYDDRDYYQYPVQGANWWNGTAIRWWQAGQEGCFVTLPALKSTLVQTATRVTNDAKIQEIRDRVQQRLNDDQAGFCQSVADDLKDVYAAANRLSGARELLKAYATLGIPRYLEGDDLMRALLLSSPACPYNYPDVKMTPADVRLLAQHVPDGDLVRCFFVAAARTRQDGNSIPKMVDWIEADKTDRVAELKGVLISALKDIRDHRLNASSPTVNGILKNSEFSLAQAQLPLVGAVVLPAEPVCSGEPARGRIVFNRTARAAETMISLTSDTAVVTVPSMVSVAEGDSYAEFAIGVGMVHALTTVNITANVSGVTSSGTMTVLPPIAALTTDTPRVFGGNPVAIDVALSCDAPSNGTLIYLSSSDPSLVQVDPSILVPPGATGTQFVVRTSVTPVTKTITVSTRIRVGGVDSSMAIPILVSGPAYVDADAPGPSHDGLTWATAFLHVQDGINGAAEDGEVWTASGTYRERVVVRPGLEVLGGFAGSETLKTGRNPSTNISLLDGGNAGSVVTFADGCARDTIFDGFTILGGSGTRGTSGRLHGGGIFCAAGSPTISRNTIGQCSADVGAGIYIGAGSPLISLCSITANSAAYNGGGICIASGNAEVVGNTLTDNIAAMSGGGIALLNSSPSVIGNLFSFNTAYYRGGGVYCEGGAPVLTDNQVQANGALDVGGGIHARNASATITRNVINGNGALSGAGMAFVGGSPSVGSNTVANNGALNYGGGVYVQDVSGGTVQANLVSGNTADYGGGISLNSSTTEVDRNWILENTAGISGGGTFVSSGKVTLRSNLIDSNGGATSGAGGIAIVGAEALMANNTVTRGAGSLGAVYGDASSKCTFANGIVAFNAVGVRLLGTTRLVHHTCVYANSGQDYGGMLDPTGTLGNIRGDPLFISSAVGDFRLLVTSPCVDAGDDALVAAGATDLYGHPRIQGDHVDLGANEYAFIAAYTLADAATALKFAAGIQTAGLSAVQRLNVVLTGASASRVDQLDAVRIARKASGLEANP